MKTIAISKSKSIQLFVKISSDAVVGSNVSINDLVVKKSAQYNFKKDLGNIDDLNNKVLSVVSNFFVSTGNIDSIMKTTNVTYTLKVSDNESHKFICKKVKINEVLFMAYWVIKLIK